jgi:hypothetical protein
LPSKELELSISGIKEKTKSQALESKPNKKETNIAKFR